MPTRDLRLKSALDWFMRLDSPAPFEALTGALRNDLEVDPAYAIALAIRTIHTPHYESYDETLRELVLGWLQAECANAHSFVEDDKFTPFFVHAQVTYQGELPKYADVPNLLAQLSRVLGVPLDALRSDGEIYDQLDISEPDKAWEVMESFAWPLGEQAANACAEPSNPNTEAKAPEGPLQTAEVLIRCLVKTEHDGFLYESLLDGLNRLPADDRPEHVRWQEGAQISPCSVFQGPLEALLALNFVHPGSVMAHQVDAATSHLASSDSPPVIYSIDLASEPIAFRDEDLGTRLVEEASRALDDLAGQLEAAQSDDDETMEHLVEVSHSVLDSVANIRLTVNAFHGTQRVSRYEMSLPRMAAVACAVLSLQAAEAAGATTLLSADTLAEPARAVIESLLEEARGPADGEDGQ